MVIATCDYREGEEEDCPRLQWMSLDVRITRRVMTKVFILGSNTNTTEKFILETTSIR